MWAHDTIAALGYMHESLKLVHRDLKLANILYQHDRFSGWAGKLWARELSYTASMR